MADSTEDYIETYKKNNFKINDIVFTLEDIPKDKLFSKRFAIITAWNPNNEKLRNAVNDQNNEFLVKELRQMNLSFDDAIGYLEDHAEESYCVYDISLSQAIELGKEFHQYSIFYNDTQTIGYYEVSTSSAILVKNI